MLAEEGRRGPVFQRGLGEAHRAGHQRKARPGAMRQFDAHAACFHLRLFKHLGHVINRPVRHARCFEHLQPFLLGALLEYIGELPGKRDAVFDALPVRGKPRILRELGRDRGRLTQ